MIPTRDLIVDYVYHNDKPTNWGSAAVTDAHNVTIGVDAHSLIEMPKTTISHGMTISELVISCTSQMI